MSTRGRKPKPNALKVLHGDRADRINPREPTAPPGAPEPPEELEGHGLAEWHRLCAELASLGILTTADRGIILVCASAYGRWRDAAADLKRLGASIETKLGGVKQSPYVAIADRASVEYRKCLADLGLTPASRSRVKTSEPGRDELGDFLGKRHV